MARRRAVTTRDIVNEAKARIAEAVAREIDRATREAVLRQAGPVLEDLSARARAVGPIGEPWADAVDRLLRRLRRGLQRRR